MTPMTPAVQHYSIRHLTRFRYSAPVRESLMQIYMQPRTEWNQRLTSFQLTTAPRAQLFAYTDYLGNAVYHFDVPREHTQLDIETRSTVEVMVPEDWRPVRADEWDAIASADFRRQNWDMLFPTRFTKPTSALDAFVAEQGIAPQGDPMASLSELNRVIYEAFEYRTEHTDVDSTIDEALTARAGVCQDLSHIMLAVVRGWGIPARYVSGYLFHREEDPDRSAADASHAWVEALIPSLGWVGFDPTNNILARERHVRVAVGRDYSEVPPTRGVYRGDAESELAVAVSVAPTDAPAQFEDFLRIVRPMPRHDGGYGQETIPDFSIQQQQQQQ